MTPEAFRRLAHAAVDLVADHLEGSATEPVFAPMTPAERAALLERPLPDRGRRPRPARPRRTRGLRAPHGQRASTLLRLGELTAGARRRRGGLPRGGARSELRRRGPRGDLRRACGGPVADGARRLPGRGQHGTPRERGLHGLPDVPRRRPAPGDGRGRLGRPGAGSPERPGTARPLPLGGGPQLHAEGGGGPGPRGGRGADGARGRRLPDGRGGAPRRHRPGPRRRAPALLRGGERGDRQHRRDRPARRGGHPLPGGGPLVPRRRRLRRRRRRGPGPRRPLRRARARGLARARPAQVALRAGGVRVRARPGRASPAGHVESACRPTSGRRRARASEASPGTRSTASSRLGASGPSSSGWSSSTWAGAAWPRWSAVTSTWRIAWPRRSTRRPTSSAWPTGSSRSCAFATRRRDGPGMPRSSTRSTSSWWNGSRPRGGRSSPAPCCDGRFALRACVLHYGTTEADIDALIGIVQEAGAHLARAS